jgi:hypothetical protein
MAHDKRDVPLMATTNLLLAKSAAHWNARVKPEHLESDNADAGPPAIWEGSMSGEGIETRTLAQLASDHVMDTAHKWPCRPSREE